MINCIVLLDKMGDQKEVRAALHTTQAASQGMSGLMFGGIINIGTNLVQHPVVPYHDYNTSKAALIGFTRNMASELEKKGITVNMVSGGLLQPTDASAPTPDEIFDQIKENTPIKRITTPKELSWCNIVFCFILETAATGQNFIVDGGLVME